MNTKDENARDTRPRRKVGLLLGTAIVLVPPLALLTLRPRHSLAARAVSLGWLALCGCTLALGPPPAEPQASAAAAPQAEVAQPVPVKPKPPSEDEVARQLAERVVAQRVREGRGDFKIEINEAEHRSFRLTMIYQHTPPSSAWVQADTAATVRELLDALVASGRKPADEFIGVIVFAERPVKGVTGKELVQSFGSTSYNRAEDRLQWQPPLKL